MKHWVRLQLKRSIHVWSSTSSSPHTRPPLKTGEPPLHAPLPRGHHNVWLTCCNVTSVPNQSRELLVWVIHVEVDAGLRRLCGYPRCLPSYPPCHKLSLHIFQAYNPSSSSFSTDDDNDVEVEALEGDSELNLVTEVWVEPQYGRVGPGPESWKHLQDLTYSEIPQAVSDPTTAPCLLPGLSLAFTSLRPEVGPRVE